MLKCAFTRIPSTLPRAVVTSSAGYGIKFTYQNLNVNRKIFPISIPKTGIYEQNNILRNSSLLRYYCDYDKGTDKGPIPKLQQLRKAVTEYGSTVIVFHVTISLASLGAFYALVSAGLDMKAILLYLGFTDFANSNTFANAGTFAIAYAIHKALAPVRITITLLTVPFIVRYLRNIGFLKKP